MTGFPRRDCRAGAYGDLRRLDRSAPRNRSGPDRRRGPAGREGETDLRLGRARRQSAEWGPAYSGAMADCNEAIRPLLRSEPPAGVFRAKGFDPAW